MYTAEELKLAVAAVGAHKMSKIKSILNPTENKKNYVLTVKWLKGFVTW